MEAARKKVPVNGVAEKKAQNHCHPEESVGTWALRKCVIIRWKSAVSTTINPIIFEERSEA